MADLNLMHGGWVRAFGSDVNAGQYPSIYPAPTKTASHHKPHLFTPHRKFGPLRGNNSSSGLTDPVNTNAAYAVRTLGPTLALQTANLIGKKIALHWVPAQHLLTAIRVHAHGGTNGAGMTFSVFVDEVNSATGALIGPVVVPAALAGIVTGSATVPTEAFATISPTTGGAYTAASTYEVGIIITAVPASSPTYSGLIADFDGHIDLVMKTESFDAR